MASSQFDLTNMDLPEILLLPERNKKIIFYPGSKYQTILDKIKGYFEKYKKIRTFRKKPDFLSFLKNYKESIIFYATENKDFDVVKFYIDRNLVDSGVVIAYVLRNNDIVSLKYLFDQNKIYDINDEISEGGYSGISAAHIAAQNENIEMLKFLIEKGSDINIMDQDERTVLSIAINNENYEIVEMLTGVTETKYQITGFLGQGTYGTVFKVVNKESGKEVALKILDLSKFSIEQVNNEFESLLYLSFNKSETGCYKYIACLLDYFKINNYYYVVTELLSKGDLQNYMEELKLDGDLINPEELLKMMFQLTEALTFIHSKGYAHRDIKPENIGISKEDNYKFLDFGLSCSNDCYQTGTLDFLPPEYYKGILEKEEGPKGLLMSQLQDVWSLGSVFYEISNQESVYNNMGFFNKRYNIKSMLKKSIPLSNYDYKGVNIKMIKSINNIINKMLTYDYNKRPSAQKIYEEIKLLYNSYY